MTAIKTIGEYIAIKWRKKQKEDEVAQVSANVSRMRQHLVPDGEAESTKEKKKNKWEWKSSAAAKESPVYLIQTGFREKAREREAI